MKTLVHFLNICEETEGVINEVHRIESSMIAYKPKINIFKEMRYFLHVLSKFGFHGMLGTSSFDFI